MSDPTPQESAAPEAHIPAGAAALPQKRLTTRRIVTVTSAVVLVGGLGAAAVAFALGQAPSAGLAAPSSLPTATASSTPTSTVTPAPTSTVNATPTPAGTPLPPAAALESGDMIADEGQWELVHDRQWGSWQMPDGRSIAIDPKQPLPPQLRADIQSRLDAIPNGTVDQTEGATDALMRTSALLVEFEEQTGKAGIMVRYNSTALVLDPADPPVMRWYAMASGHTWPLATERDTILADLEKWVAASPTPETWVVFVGPGDAVASN